MALFEETRPKQFDDGLIEEFQAPTAIGLVEDAEVNRPQLSLVGRYEAADLGH